MATTQTCFFQLVRDGKHDSVHYYLDSAMHLANAILRNNGAEDCCIFRIDIAENAPANELVVTLFNFLTCGAPQTTNYEHHLFKKIEVAHSETQTTRVMRHLPSSAPERA